MRKAAGHAHPSDEALTSMIDGAAPAGATAAEFGGCPVCAARVDELLTARRLLSAVGATERSPNRNLARAAMRTLRMRRTAVDNVNEMFAAFQTFVRGVSAYLAGPDGGSRKTQGNPPINER